MFNIKEIIYKKNIYVFVPFNLELFYVKSKEDEARLIREVILKEKDEYKTKNNKRKYLFDKNNKKISTVSLDIAHGCTLKCKYCYLSAGYHKQEYLSEDIFLKILDFLKYEKHEEITFYFAGEGEPTLNFNLLRKIPQLCRDKGFINCKYEITTNGTLLTPSIIDFLKKENFIVSVSLDGDERFDRNRIYKNGTPSFPVVFERIKALKETNIKFVCKTTILPDSKELLQMFDFFEKNKIPFYIGFATASFDGTYIPKITDVIGNLKKQLDLVVEYYIKLIKNGQYIYARKIIEDINRIRTRSTMYIACEAGINSFYFDMRGDIYICSCHNRNKELSVGNIYDGIDYNKIDKLNLYPKEVEEYRECNECWLKYLCAGSCVAAKWADNEDTLIPSKYQCSLNEVYWIAIIKIYIGAHEYLEGNINFLK